MDKKKTFNLDEKKRFNLDDLIHEDDIKRAEAAAAKGKARAEEIAWRRENDPNFEEWYANECKKIRERAAARTVNKTIEEFDEIYKHCRGL